MTDYVAVSLTLILTLALLLGVRRAVGLRFGTIVLGAASMLFISVVSPPFLGFVLRPLGLGYHGGVFINGVFGAPLIEEVVRVAVVSALLAWLGRGDFVRAAASFGLGWGLFEFIYRNLPALAAVAGQPYLWAPAFDKIMLAGPPIDAVWLTVARGAVIVWHVTFTLLVARAIATRRVSLWLAALALHALFNAAGLIFEARFGWDGVCAANLVCAGVAFGVAVLVTRKPAPVLTLENRA